MTLPYLRISDELTAEGQADGLAVYELVCRKQQSAPRLTNGASGSKSGVESRDYFALHRTWYTPTTSAFRTCCKTSVAGESDDSSRVIGVGGDDSGAVAEQQAALQQKSFKMLPRPTPKQLCSQRGQNWLQASAKMVTDYVHRECRERRQQGGYCTLTTIRRLDPQVASRSNPTRKASSPTGRRPNAFRLVPRNGWHLLSHRPATSAYTFSPACKVSSISKTAKYHEANACTAASRKLPSTTR